MAFLAWRTQVLAGGSKSDVRVRLRVVGALMCAMVSAGVFGLLRPGLWSPTWWLAAFCVAQAFLLAMLPHDLLRGQVAAALTLTGDLTVAAILLLNPARPELGLLFLPVSGIGAALSRGRLLPVHTAIVVAALSIHVWQAGSGATAWFVAVSASLVISFVATLVRALDQQYSKNQSLHRLMELLPVLKAQGVQDVVEAAVRQLVKATASDTGVVLLLDDERRVLRPHYVFCEQAISPEEEAAWLAAQLPVGEGLSGWVAEHGQPLMTGDAARDPRSRSVPGTPDVDESIMIVPLMTNGRLYGVLRLDRQGLHRYRPEDLDLLQLMAAHVSDALSRAELEERVARTDALTGVYNRHFLNEWSAALKPSDQEISVLMIDCRKFKQINDGFGHLTGDRILQAAARLITGSVRSGDLVVRYGGDEFLVVLRQAGAAEAESAAARLAERVKAWNASQPPDEPMLVLDIGVDTAAQSDFHALLGRADARMYASKQSALTPKVP